MKNNILTDYFRSSWHELSKVTWPTKNQAVRLTSIVLSFVAVSTLFLAIADYAFLVLYKMFLNLN